MSDAINALVVLLPTTDVLNFLNQFGNVEGELETLGFDRADKSNINVDIVNITNDLKHKIKKHELNM